MTVKQVIMDTDILSAVMRKNPLVLPKARSHISEYGQFTFSIITLYEILRGLKVKGASKQAIVFDRFYKKNLSTGQKIRQDKQDEQDYFIFHHGKS